jgi:hypothetical protein
VVALTSTIDMTLPITLFKRRAMKTAEEMRATNAARQKRWRGKHKWLAEQRRLALYGKSKAQAASVTYNATDNVTTGLTGGREGSPATAGASGAPVEKRPSGTGEPLRVRVPADPGKEDPNGRVVEEEYSYDADPCDARTPAEKKQDEEQQAARLRKQGGQFLEQQRLREEAVSAEMESQIAGVKRWAANRRRKKQVKGVEVEL